MIPFVGGSYTLDVRKADVQRTVNMFPVASENAGSAEPTYLQSIPGYDLFSDEPAAPSGEIGWCVPANNEDEDTATVESAGFSNFTSSLGDVIIYCAPIPVPDDDADVEFELLSWTPVTPGDAAPTFQLGFRTCGVRPSFHNPIFPDSMLDGVAHVGVKVNGAPCDGYCIVTYYHNDDTGGYGGIAWEHS